MSSPGPWRWIKPTVVDNGRVGGNARENLVLSKGKAPSNSPLSPFSVGIAKSGQRCGWGYPSARIGGVATPGSSPEATSMGCWNMVQGSTSSSPVVKLSRSTCALLG